MEQALHIIGVSTIALGIAHLFLPQIVAFRASLSDRPQPLFIPFVRYQTTRRDLMGLIQVMNYAVSFALVTIGAVDLVLYEYLSHAPGRAAALWIAGWWFLRAAAQFHLGIRPFDIGVVVLFVLVGIVHLAAGLP